MSSVILQPNNKKNSKILIWLCHFWSVYLLVEDEYE